MGTDGVKIETLIEGEATIKQVGLLAELHAKGNIVIERIPSSWKNIRIVLFFM